MARIAKKSGTYHHGDLRRVLLETAVKVVEHDGVSALSLQALARRAGVSSGAPYHHFESREQLLAAIAGEGFQLLVSAMQRGAEEMGAGAAAELRGLGLGYVRFATAHRGHFRVMFRPELAGQLDPEGEECSSEAFNMLRRSVERCQAEGLAAPGDAMPLILVAWSCVHGASALWIDGTLGSRRMLPDTETLAQTISASIVQLISGRP